MAVDEDVGRLDAPAVLERRLTRSATEPEVGGTLREHVVRREDQRPGFASGVVQLATPPEPADERDPGKHQNAPDHEPAQDLARRDTAAWSGGRCSGTDRPVVEVARRSLSPLHGWILAAALVRPRSFPPLNNSLLTLYIRQTRTKTSCTSPSRGSTSRASVRTSQPYPSNGTSTHAWRSLVMTPRSVVADEIARTVSHGHASRDAERTQHHGHRARELLTEAALPPREELSEPLHRRWISSLLVVAVHGRVGQVPLDRHHAVERRLIVAGPPLGEIRNLARDGAGELRFVGILRR